MQTGANLILGKRARYYHANMDLDSLEQGVDYDRLKPSYVIFICTFDYYGIDKPVYFFPSKSMLRFSSHHIDFSPLLRYNTKCSAAGSESHTIKKGEPRWDKSLRRAKK